MLINTRFKIGEECYYVYTKKQKYPFLVKIGRVTFDSSRKNKIMYDTDFNDDDGSFSMYVGMPEKNLFETYEEAEKYLQSIQ